MSVGLDIGTSFIVSAREKKNKVVYKRQRDGFFTITAETAISAKFIEQGLKKAGSDFFKKGDSFYIIGDAALEKALERRAVLQRPLHKGVINSKEPEALEMIKQIISGVLGKPKEENEVCIYSVPENPIDQVFDIVYHKNILNQILGDLGYKASSLNEAEAIAYSELMEEGLTGITVSWGAGMTNFAVMSSGNSELRFAVAKGGDFIDEKVAISLGLSPSVIQAEKESGLDLNAPTNKIQNAICIYYKHLVSSVIDEAVEKITSADTLPKFSKATLVVSGGTTMPAGFVEILTDKLNQVVFPIELGDIRKAELSLETVAKGCWLAASVQE